MNSLNRRYCVSSLFVALLMSFVMLVFSAKFRNTNPCVTENSALLKNDICVVRMAKKVKERNDVQPNVKEQKVELQKVEEMMERDVPDTSALETKVSENSLPDKKFNSPINSTDVSENEGKNEAVDSGKVNESEKSYKSYVLKRIAEKKTYPLSARKKGCEGKVKIHLVIDRDGKILALEVCEPCDYEVLNNAALKSVEKAAPFKKMPAVMTSLDFIFVLDFKLSASTS